MGRWPEDNGRLALACWDYAWPLRSEYQSVERMLDEVVERGFNAVRLDPYPHLLATPANSVHLDRCEIFADADPRRGIEAGAGTVEIRKTFRRLLSAAADRGLKLWLTSFFLADSRARRSFVRRPEDFIQVWSETLELARQWGHLDTIVAVDLCHHFPFPPWSHGVLRRVFGRAPHRPLPEHWSGEQERRVESYLVAVPRALRALFPDLAFGLSAAAGDTWHLRQMDTSELDFLELGLWLNDDPRFRLASGEHLPVPGMVSRRLAGPVRGALLEATGEHWRSRLLQHMEQRLAFTRLRRLRPVLGEGYLNPAPGSGRLSRRWAGFTEAVVAKAVEDGVSVITPTSLAAPHTPWLWREADWLAHLNQLIRTGPIQTEPIQTEKGH